MAGVAGHVIVIGNGGADFKGARGSISAYDLQSGEFKWRFYTVPRDPHLVLDGASAGSHHYNGIFDAADPDSLADLLSREPDLVVER